MPTDPKLADLFKALYDKASLKQEIYAKTLEVFNSFKKVSETMAVEYGKTFRQAKPPVPFEYKDISQFEFDLRFGGDMLIFFMHSNIFETPRDHEVMKTSYIKEDKSRSYCGIIHIFNFLNDSFKYDRINDVGYLIGRIFVNREKHYFVEGKREIGLLYNNFPSAELTGDAILTIIESSIRYTINFDLLTPPYENLKEATVEQMKSIRESMSIRTGKRLGFKFQADTIEDG
jgi:hypothetical protein